MVVTVFDDPLQIPVVVSILRISKVVPKLYSPASAQSISLSSRHRPRSYPINLSQSSLRLNRRKIKTVLVVRIKRLSLHDLQNRIDKVVHVINQSRNGIERTDSHRRLLPTYVRQIILQDLTKSSFPQSERLSSAVQSVYLDSYSHYLCLSSRLNVVAA